MTTGEVVLLAGVVVVGWFVVSKHSQLSTTSAPAPSVRPPTSGTVGTVLSTGLVNAAGRVGAVGGAVVASATGLGPVSPIVSSASSALLRTTTQGFTTGATGVVQLAKGNVGTGLVDIGKGAVETAAAPLVSAYSGAKSVIHTLGGLL